METKILWSKDLKSQKYLEFFKRIKALKIKKIVPKLVVVQVGDDVASRIYIHYKEIAAQKLGIEFEKISLSATITFEELRNHINKLNNDKTVDGIIIQFPLPVHFSKRQISTLVSPEKDADGGHPFNQGVNFTRQNVYAPKPCTPKGVIELLDFYGIKLEGKNAVVIGRSNIAGRPMSYMLSNKNATVSLIHSKTNRKKYLNLIRDADIIVSATGVKDIVTPDMISQGAIMIDIGIIRDNNKIRGDFKWKDFIGKAGAITPVPGGVGPMTVTMLMENTLTLTEKNRGK